MEAGKLRGKIEWRRGGDSNPRYLLGIHAFQACALNHSATSPPNAIHPSGGDG